MDEDRKRLRELRQQVRALCEQGKSIPPALNQELVTLQERTGQVEQIDLPDED
jgi:hypothetical protein